VIVLAPTMAAPAGYQWTAIRDHAGVPIFLWNVHGLHTIDRSYTAESIVPNSANVGCMMINNILRREGRPADIVTGHVDDAAMLEAAKWRIKAAILAGRLRKARFGVLGKPLDGYINVVADAGALRRAIGANLVDITAAEFTDAYRAGTPAMVDALDAELRATYRIEVPDGGELRDSLRLCIALATIVERHRLSGGTFNCRNEFGVHNPEINVIGCLANTYLTTSGFPFTCTGDIITAIAMFLGKHAGGDSYYCELDTIDYARDLMLCANTGEGDFCQSADPAGCCIRPSGRQSGRIARGCNVIYPMPDRPGTAIAFTPRADSKGGHAIIAAEGRIAGSPPSGLGLPSMNFKFASGSTADAVSRWILAGATHHACISSGHLARELGLVAHHLGIGLDTV
jgi:L-arabinose isomerase